MNSLTFNYLVSYFTYEEYKKLLYKKDSTVICEKVFKEQVIDAFPILKLKYQKYKSLREDGK